MRPTPFSRVSKSLLFVLILFGSGVVWLHWQLRPYAADDAYIHFRIASHLAFAGQPNYNLGDYLQASSSSGWTLLLALLFRLLGEHLAIVAVWNALVLLLGAASFVRLLQLTTNTYASAWTWAGVGVLYIALVLSASVSLMETPTTIVLVLWALHLLWRQSPFGFLVFGASVFFRFELVLWLVFVGLIFAHHNRHRLVLVTGFALLGALPFIAYNLYFWGTLLPQTIVAKSKVYTLNAVASFDLVAQALFTTTGWLPPDWNLSWLLPRIFSVLFGYGLFAFVLYHERVKPIYVPTLKWWAYGALTSGLAVAGGYIVARALVFDWYTPLFTVPLLFGSVWLGHQLNNSNLRWVLFLISIPLLLSLIIKLILYLLAGAINPAYLPQFEGHARVRKYLEVGERLRTHYPHATLLTSEIGGLGYGFKGMVADGAGLISPAALPFHPMRVPEERAFNSLGAIPLGFIEAVQPEIIVSYDTFNKPFLQSSLQENYVRFIEPALVTEDFGRSNVKLVWGVDYLTIFIRKDVYNGAPPE